MPRTGSAATTSKRRLARPHFAVPIRLEAGLRIERFACAAGACRPDVPEGIFVRGAQKALRKFPRPLRHWITENIAAAFRDGASFTAGFRA